MLLYCVNHETDQAFSCISQLQFEPVHLLTKKNNSSIFRGKMLCHCFKFDVTATYDTTSDVRLWNVTNLGNAGFMKNYS